MRFISLVLLLFCISMIGKHNPDSYFNQLFSCEQIQDLFEKQSTYGKYIIYNDARLI
jgi:hypothetical protein